MTAPHREWYITEHARERMHEMDVRERDVLVMFQDRVGEWNAEAGVHERDPPDFARDYVSNGYPNCRVRVHGRLAIPYDPRTKTIITVLWNGETAESRERGVVPRCASEER